MCLALDNGKNIIVYNVKVDTSNKIILGKPPNWVSSKLLKFNIYDYKYVFEQHCRLLTHCDRMTYVCGTKLPIIGSDNDLWPNHYIKQC